MPYFPKEEAETIQLATVVYETDENGIVMQSGRPKVLSRVLTGDTLSIVRKDSPMGVRRSFYSQFQAAQNREKRIVSLTKQLEGPGLPKEEFLAIQAEIEEFGAMLSSFDLMCKFVADSLRSWDYFATKADYDAGRAIELTAEAIRANCDSDILSQVIDHLNNRTEQESAEGKGLSAASPNGSNQREALENAQTSTATMQ